MKTLTLAILILFAASLVCLHSMTVQYSPDYDRLYNLDNLRYIETLFQFQQTTFSNDQRLVLLMRLATTYCFTCSQVGNLINIFGSDDSAKIQGLQALLTNIIDPQNNGTQIIPKFTTDAGKLQAENLLANITACQTQGDAPTVLPFPTLNYTNTWNDSDVSALINQITNTSSSYQKIFIAQTALLGKSRILTPNQTLLLFQAFTVSDDFITLATIINERLIGLTCEQIQKILAKFLLANDKLNILTAFKNSVIDTENKYNLLNSFYLPAEQNRARLILAQFQAKSTFFGAPSGQAGFILACSETMATNITLSTGETLTRFQYLKREFEKTILNFDNVTKFDYGMFGREPIVWQKSQVLATSNNILDALKLFNAQNTSGTHSIYQPYFYLAQMTTVDTIYIITDRMDDTSGEPDPYLLIQMTKQWHHQSGVKVHTIGMLMGDDGQTPENKTQFVSFLKAVADASNSTFRILE